MASVGIFGCLLLLILSSLAAGQKPILEANVNEITVGRSKDIQLTCRQNLSSLIAVPEPLRGHLKWGARVQIVKLDPFGNKMKFAEVQFASNVTSHADGNVIVGSNIENDEEMSLTVKWPIATVSTVGAYGCQVFGFDDDANVVKLDAKPVLIKERMMTWDEVTRNLHSLAAQYDEKIQSMASEIEKLKGELHSMTVKSRVSQANLKTDLDEIKIDVNSRFVTKEAFESSLIEIKNVTKDGLKELKTVFQIQIDLCLANVSMVSASQKDFADFILTEMKRTERTMNATESQIFALLPNVTNLIEKMENKIEQVVDEKCRQENCLMSTTTPTRSSAAISMASTSTNASSPHTRQAAVWPEGFYGLIQPSGLECPHNGQSGNVTVFRSIPFEATLQQVQATKTITSRSVHDLFSITISSSKIDYCLKLESDSSVKINWPAGSYCVESYEGRCPENFEREYFMISAHIDELRQHYKSQFCCRRDGSENTAIKLPTSSQFYLVRNAKECQQIDGMRVDQESMLLWTKPGVALKMQTRKVTRQVATFDVIRYLCHYQPLTNNSSANQES